jgi:pimeloyl-ACP methyl ester carboxylesterase
MYEEKLIETNDIRLHVIFAGPENGKPIVLLHGFPEFWYGWRHQIQPLASAGYRVIVPDQRGYNLSEKPKGVNQYHTSLLSQDIVGLLDRLGYPEVDLVGHDWGGVVAWHLATNYPDRLRNLIILNAPHQDAMSSAPLHDPSQIVRSWYIYLFQLPWLAEHLFFPSFANRAWNTAKHGSITEEDMAHYREAWAQPGAVQATLNWYRAAFRDFIRAIVGIRERSRMPQSGSKTTAINVPTLILWGEEDVSLSKWLAHESAARCTQSTLRFFPGVGHWLQHDEPQEVTQSILNFLIDVR